MEMLVVLVLAGLISTLLIQGLTHVLNLRVRFLSQLEKQTTEALQEHWFREATTALMPDHRSGNHIFSGNDIRFQGLTLNPLKGTPGAPTPIIMEFVFKEGNILLQYKERDDESWEIACWNGDDAAFSYLAPDNRWYQQWPPGLKDATQMPEGILLKVDEVRGTLIWFAGISGRREPKPLLKDMLGI